MHTEPNKLNQTLFVLLGTILLIHLVSRLVPDTLTATFSFNKIDYLEPLLKTEAPPKQETVLVNQPQQTHVFTDTVKKDTVVSRHYPKGLVYIEDFSLDQKHMLPFLDALESAGKADSSCRIAFYGDSFIEGDILTMDLRDSLQKVFGGKGIGFLPAASEVSMFRRSLPSETEGWKTFGTSPLSAKVAPGICGFAYQPNAKAEIKFHPQRPLNKVRLFFRNTGKGTLVRSVINRKVQDTDSVPTSSALNVLTLAEGKDTIRQYKLHVEGNSDLTVYGLSFESGPGVYLDNFSIRGNSGTGLGAIPQQQLADFQQLLDYKLIVLEFGLNVSAPTTKDFTFYEKSMTKVVQRLKTIFPTTTFLLLSTSDRSYRQNGTYVTMPSIPLLVQAQRNIAKTSGILFWNMYQAMGGENSMVAYVSRKPALANKDYTHINFLGGKKIAGELMKALMHEYDYYKKQKKKDMGPMAVK